MKTLLTYHNDPKFKSAFVAETIRHRKQDRYISGSYSSGEGDSFKGCSIGCSVHSLKILGRNGMAFNDHAGCAAALGWPEWLCLLQDTIFEGLPEGKRPAWTEKLAASVPVGVNLDLVRWHLCAFILKENIARVLKLKIADDLKENVVNAVRKCLAVHESAIESGLWDDSAARSAADSARSAADSAADSAAYSAAYSADSAYSAAYSADSAARSADSAARSADLAARSADLARSAYSAARSAADSAAYSAYSADSAAYSADSAARSADSAARSAAMDRYASELIRLLKAA